MGSHSGLAVHRWIAVILGMLGDFKSLMRFRLLGGCCWALEIFSFLLLILRGRSAAFPGDPTVWGGCSAHSSWRKSPGREVQSPVTSEHWCKEVEVLSYGFIFLQCLIYTRIWKIPCCLCVWLLIFFFFSDLFLKIFFWIGFFMA